MAIARGRVGNIKIQPLEDRVVVERVEAAETTSGGIVLPDSAREKPRRGIVIAVGPGRLLKSGQRGEVAITVGDEVVFSPYGAVELNLSGNDFTILREADILASLPGGPMTPGPRPRRPTRPGKPPKKGGSQTTGQPLPQPDEPPRPGPGGGPPPPRVT